MASQFPSGGSAISLQATRYAPIENAIQPSEIAKAVRVIPRLGASRRQRSDRSLRSFGPNPGLKSSLEKTVDAQPSCSGKKQPDKTQRIQRFIQFSEVIEAADVLQFHRQDRDDHVDDHRNRNEAHSQPKNCQRSAEELGVRGKGGVERRVGNSPLCEPRRECVEVVNLRPPSLHEEVADKQPHQEGGNPPRSGQPVEGFSRKHYELFRVHAV